MSEEGRLDRARLLAEALIFASADPVPLAAIAAFLESQGLERELAARAVEAAREGCAGHAVELVAAGGGWQFRTRAEFGPALEKVVQKPRRLSRSAMETLAIIAYHQPCTRGDIEAIRGVSLGQPVLDALIEDALIEPRGRKEIPGRPVLWGTTRGFLEAFGLPDLSALPRREDFVLDRAPTESAPTESAPTESAPIEGPTGEERPVGDAEGSG